MRALIGAVVGLVVATALVAVAGSVLKHYSYLAILVGGIAAGLIMRMLASGSGSAYAKGALAALVAGVAAVAGQLALASWHQAQGAAIPKPSAKVISQAPKADQTLDAEGEVIADIPVDTVALPDNIGSHSAFSVKASKQGDDTENVVCIALGCLLAYQLGKGATAAPAASEEADPDSEPEYPAESPASDPDGDE